jgi:hypothetical protein
MATEMSAKELEIEGRKNDIDTKTPETSSEVSQTRNRAEFLSSFTQEENKAIMRKVDRRFLIIIGLMYVIKNVSLSAMSNKRIADDDTDRLPKRGFGKGFAGGAEEQYLG